MGSNPQKFMCKKKEYLFYDTLWTTVDIMVLAKERKMQKTIINVWKDFSWRAQILIFYWGFSPDDTLLEVSPIE